MKMALTLSQPVDFELSLADLASSTSAKVIGSLKMFVSSYGASSVVWRVVWRLQLTFMLDIATYSRLLKYSFHASNFS